jgi:hypothetical protein
LLFGGLICLGLLILVIAGIVVLVNSLNKSRQQAPTQQIPPQEIKPPVEANPTGFNSGKPVQFVWSSCPYCGEKPSMESEPPETI